MARTQTTKNKMFYILTAVSEQYGNDWFYIKDAKQAIQNLPEDMHIKEKDLSNKLTNMAYDGLLFREIEPSGRSFNKYRITERGNKFIIEQRRQRERELEQQKLEHPQPKPATEQGQEQEQEGKFSINLVLSRKMMEGIIEAYNRGDTRINLNLEDKE